MKVITGIREKAIPVRGSYDVAVAGGGIAGVAAALAAARLGKKVVLIERMFSLGGLATLGLVTIYLPLCDGCGNQVSFGLAEELLKLSLEHGWERDYPDTWLSSDNSNCPHGSQRYKVRYNAQVFSILMEQLLRKEQVDILYGTLVTDVCMEDDSIKALIIENKDGRSAIETGGVADATGDADISTLCGAGTAMYGNGNGLAAWYYETLDGVNQLRILGIADVIPEEKDDSSKPLSAKRISGIDALEVSRMMEESHRHSLEAFLKKGRVSEAHSLAAISAIPQLRMTRRVCGAYTMDDTEIYKHFDDSIGMIGDWRKRGPVYEIPFRTLYSERIKNLAVAGRCISVRDAMWDITRVIPACAVTGQAAGTALALSNDLAGLDIDLLQKTLRHAAVKLHRSELRQDGI